MLKCCILSINALGILEITPFIYLWCFPYLEISEGVLCILCSNILSILACFALKHRMFMGSTISLMFLGSIVSVYILMVRRYDYVAFRSSQI